MQTIFGGLVLGADIRIITIDLLIAGDAASPLGKGGRSRRLAGLLADPSDRRKEHAGQDADDGNHGQQLDEGETVATTWSHEKSGLDRGRDIIRAGTYG
jgi:hypothetical protein